MKEIIELLDDYGVEVEKSMGDKLVCFCPFHDDKNTPNLIVYPNTNSFHCFTCGVGGDVIEFVAKSEGVSRQKAEQMLSPKVSTVEHLRQKFDHMKDKSDDIEHSPINDEINFKLSKGVFEYFKGHKEEGEHIFKVMRWLDDNLKENIEVESSYEFMKEFIERLKRGN